MSIQVIKAFPGSEVGPFVMVEWNSGAKEATITLGGGFNMDQRLSAANILDRAARELEGKD